MSIRHTASDQGRELCLEADEYYRSKSPTSKSKMGLIPRGYNNAPTVTVLVVVGALTLYFAGVLGPQCGTSVGTMETEIQRQKKMVEECDARRDEEIR